MRRRLPGCSDSTTSTLYCACERPASRCNCCSICLSRRWYAWTKWCQASDSSSESHRAFPMVRRLVGGVRLSGLFTLLAQHRVAPAVDEVDDDTERHPDEEPDPR